MEIVIKINNYNYIRYLEKRAEASFIPKYNKPNIGYTYSRG